MELHQAPQYKQYIAAIGWTTLAIDGQWIYLKHIPLYGTIAKLQRWEKLPDIEKLTPFLQKHHVTIVAFEPAASIKQGDAEAYGTQLKKHFRLNTSPYLATKSMRVDISPSEDVIFHAFSEAKRRAVRRAQKNNIRVVVNDDIHLLIKTKNASAGMFGFITTYGAKQLWDAFTPDVSTVLAYEENNTKPLGCIFLIYFDKVAYYWIAGATKKGKKLFAPTLLAWEAMKEAKKHGCTTFDFIGVWDERLPNQNRDWLGFTKFKEGFGGKALYYPIAFLNL